MPRITSFEVRLISTMMWRSGELFQQRLRLVLIHDVDSMADAFGVSEIDCLPDVEAKAIGRDEAKGELASVERYVDVWINAVKIVEHQHLAMVFGHG